MVFIASDGASVTSGVKGGIAAKFTEEEELSWLSFIWCFHTDLKLQYLIACISIYCLSNNVYVISSICVKNLAKS